MASGAARVVKILQQAASRRHVWLAALGYLAAAAVILWPMPFAPAERVVGDPFGDPLLNAWILGWDAERLRHGLDGLWQAPFFFPATDTLAWSEHLLGVAVFTAPVYWATGSIVATYNLALMGSVVLAGLGVYLLAFDVTGRKDAAFVAGLLFACLPYRVAQHPHLQVLMAGWMPVALWALRRFLISGSWAALVGFAVAFALQALSNGYFLFFLAIPVAVVVLADMTTRIRQRQAWLPTVLRLALAAAAIAAVLAPVAAAYLRVRATYGFARDRGEMINYSATLASYASVSSSSWLWGNLLPTGKAERELFPGLALCVVAATGLAIGWRRRDARLFAILAIVGVVMTMGPEPRVGDWRLPTGPYDWLGVVPGVNGLRVPARFVMVVYVALTVLAAIGLAQATERLSVRARSLVVCATAILAMGDGLSTFRVLTFPRPEMADEIAFYRWLAHEPRGPMLELPIGGASLSTRYMSGTLIHGNPIVNGYSGYGWGLQDFFAGSATGEPDLIRQVPDAARSLGVRYIAVHRALFRERQAWQTLLAALNEPHDEVARVVDIGNTTVVVLHDAPPSPEPTLSAPLRLDGCRAAASHNDHAAGLALDGALDTRWLAGTPQRGDEWFSVACGETRLLTAVRLLLDRRSYSAYPRRLAIDVSEDGATFKTIWDGGVIPELASSFARHESPVGIALPVPPSAFRTVRLRQVGQTPRNWFWAVPELQLFGH